jgi:hypothetical protein
VRVAGDTVAKGFAFEVVDRGLGLSPRRLAELNERLADPPEFNPSDSERLGLFVVGRLAKRHGIRVTLKASPYGGATAIVLIPRHLVVTEEAFRAGLPAEPAAIGMAPPGTSGNHAAAELAGPTGFIAVRDRRELGVPGPQETPVVRISGPPRRSPESTPESVSRGAHAIPRGAESSGTGAEPRAGELPRGGHAAAAATRSANGSGQPAFDVFTPRRRTQGTGDTLPVVPAGAYAGSQATGPGADGDEQGLPRRIKQASLAPQLRADPPRRLTAAAASAVSARPAGGPAPAGIRQTISALQRGWQEGRWQRAADPVPGEPPPRGAVGDQEPAGGDKPGGESDGT